MCIAPRISYCTKMFILMLSTLGQNSCSHWEFSKKNTIDMFKSCSWKPTENRKEKMNLPNLWFHETLY